MSFEATKAFITSNKEALEIEAKKKGLNLDTLTKQLEEINLSEKIASADFNMDLLSGDVGDKLDRMVIFLEKHKNSAVESVVDSAMDVVTEQVGDLGGKAGDYVKAEINERFPLAQKFKFVAELIGTAVDKVVSWISDMFKGAMGGLSGMGGGFLSALGIDSAIAGETNKEDSQEATAVGDDDSGIEAEQENTTIAGEADSQTVSNIGEVSENIENSTRNNELRSKAEVVGYQVIAKMSGLNYAKGEEGLVLESIKHKSIGEVKGLLFSGGDLKQQLGIDNIDIDPEKVATIILGLIGPVNEEFLESRLSQEYIKKALFVSKGVYTDVATKLFHEDELRAIENDDYKYDQFDITVLCRLITLNMQALGSLFLGHTAKVIENAGAKMKDFLLDESVYNQLLQLDASTQHNEIYPVELSTAFDSMLGSKQLSLSIDHIAAQATPNIAFGDKNYEKLKQIIVFKDSLLSQVTNEYGLALQGFESDLHNNLTWGKVLSLYLLFEGKDMGSVDGFQNALGYAWAHNTLSPGLRGEYEAKLIEKIAKDQGEDNSKILTVALFRIIGLDRDRSLSHIQKLKGNIDGTIASTLYLNQIEDPFKRQLAIGAVEVGGVSLLLKILAGFPLTRAVLLATSGVAGVTIYYGLREGLHQKLQGDVGDYYREFLTQIAANTEYKNLEALENAVKNEGLGLTGVVSMLGKLDLENLIQNIKSE